MKILIDGYNLIFECGLHGKRVNSGSLARAREMLLRNLAHSFPDSKSGEVTVVFDAQRRALSGQQERASHANIEILYSIEFEDADEMIEALIQKHSAPKQLTVVSSDHRIQKAAIRRKATAIDSGDWYDQLVSRQDSGAASQQVEPKTKPTQQLLTEEDLSIFKEDLGLDSERPKRGWPDFQ